MRDNLSYSITYDNIDRVRSQIALKQDSSVPIFGLSTFKGCFSPVREVENTLTDFDHFPYSRYFRGVYSDNCPRIIEREAGWRPRDDKAYKKEFEYRRSDYPKSCFETSLIFPRCIISNIAGEEQEDYRALFLNRVCVPYPI